MIQREWTKGNINDAFFPIKTSPVLWDDGLDKRIVPGQKVIFDSLEKRSLSVVSSKYRVVTNQEAFDWADYVIKRIFPGLSLQEFSCFHVFMPKTKSFCRIDLIIPRGGHSPFPDIFDSWTPFVRISNSYNRTLKLKYEIGFCRWICLNGVIFNQKGIQISINHTGRIDSSIIKKLVNEAKNVEGIESLWEKFDKKMVFLKRIEIPDSMALPVYCKAFKININKDELSLKQKEDWAEKATQIINSANEYFAELGNNAYALMNVLTDYASYPAATSNTTILVNAYQRKVGDWIDEIIAASSKEDFNLYDYIGKDAMNMALFLETLIKKQNKLNSLF
jgi:sulfur relay (sulfurtransferase) DsrC/TusE family protein